MSKKNRSGTTAATRKSPGPSRDCERHGCQVEAGGIPCLGCPRLDAAARDRLQQ